MDVLRKEWGFERLVMSDWGAGDNPVEQIKAQNDLIMPGDDTIVEKLVNAVEEGVLSLEEVEKCAKRVLEFIARTATYRGHHPSGKPRLVEHSKIAYQAAVEGIVLLKNSSRTLPLRSGTRIAPFGTGIVETIKSGMGSGHNHPPYVVTLLEGLKAAGFTVDEELANMYVKYVYEKRGEDFIDKLYHREVYPDPLPQDIVSREEVEKYTERNDIALITITRISGEGWDRKPVEGDYHLSRDEIELIKRVSKAFHTKDKRVVVILNIAGPVEVYSWRDLVDAIIVAWLPGQEAGKAIADILAGRVTPSGKLPLTFPRDWLDTPVVRSAECYPGVPLENPERVVYCENIYVGYRYYDTFNVEPAYEFGFGLSYTIFEYKNLMIEQGIDKMRIFVEVSNAGDYPGKEVVQVYVKAPNRLLERSLQELKAFKKTRLLSPGEAETLVFEIPFKDLAAFDDQNKMWILEEGMYEFRVGASSRDIRFVARVYIPGKAWTISEYYRNT